MRMPESQSHGGYFVVEEHCRNNLLLHPSKKLPSPEVLYLVWQLRQTVHYLALLPFPPVLFVWVRVRNLDFPSVSAGSTAFTSTHSSVVCASSTTVEAASRVWIAHFLATRRFLIDLFLETGFDSEVESLICAYSER
jgi:hypothetical protein